jgi:hypothetical protein
MLFKRQQAVTSVNQSSGIRNPESYLLGLTTRRVLGNRHNDERREKREDREETANKKINNNNIFYQVGKSNEARPFLLIEKDVVSLISSPLWCLALPRSSDAFC